MKKNISKTNAKETITKFFSKDNFSPKEVKKIKKIAMKYKLSLDNYRKMFCKKCLSKLHGKTKVSSLSKTIICASCGYKNRYSIN